MPVDVSVLTALEATTALDDFNYTGENPISHGGVWTNPVISGDDNIRTTGTTADRSGASTASAYRNDQNFGPDMAAMYTVTSKPSAGDGLVGIFFHLQGSGLGSGTPDGYIGEVRVRATTDEFRIQRFDAGVETVLSSGTLQEISDGDKFAVVRSGNAIELWWKTGSTWTFIVTVTDSTYTGAGKVGIALNDASAVSAFVDDFKASTTAAAATTLGAPSPPVTRVRLRAY